MTASQGSIPWRYRVPVRDALALLAIFALLLAYAWYLPPGPGAPSVLDPARLRVGEETHIREGLRDAESARFRDLFLSSSRGHRFVICGEVNQRDRTGGYGGFERFISSPTFKALESEVGDETMDELWADLCKRKR